MEKQFLIVNLFMYEKNGQEEYASILVAESKDQLEDLFYTAMSEIEKNHTQLEVSAYIIGENLNLNAVASHIRNSIYEEKAVFTAKMINILDTLPDLSEQFSAFEKSIFNDHSDDQIVENLIQQLAH